MFYTKAAGSRQALLYAEIRLTDGGVLRQPEVVYEDTSRSIYLEDVSLDPDANPLALVRLETDHVHWTYLCSWNESGWDTLSILELRDGVSPSVWIP
ncbi:MAG: hypothetical protein IPP40_15415 [bacterium]|nr:hypothetical protein [bacterium]